jgi:hypothetical protein
MAEKDKSETPSNLPGEPPRERPEPVIPGYWGPNMLVYGDISRLLFRMHRNVAAHMDAHKRLMERLQSVFNHEQQLVLELARLVDETVTQTQRAANGERPAPGMESMDKIFEHANNAMKESGRMLTDIQLEALSLLQHYIQDAADAAIKPDAKKPE